MTKIDIHQHVWTPPLVGALESRHELPFIRRESELAILFLAGERPYVIDARGESRASRRAELERDGVERALVCLSSPLGIEALPRSESLPLIEAFHAGALALGPRFGVWGAIALDDPDPGDVERALERGCVGISLPAGALGGVGRLHALGAILTRLEELDAPLLVHPGPGRGARAAADASEGAAFADPLWWPALTRYVAQMQAAWLAFASAGRRSHPRLRVIFTMLAGLAPLQLERLQARGGPELAGRDPLSFYDTSSYGPRALEALAPLVGAGQFVFGSDRPLVVEPSGGSAWRGLDWGALQESALRALGDRGAAGGPPARCTADFGAAPVRREASLL